MIDALDIPGECLPRQTVVEVIGNREAVVLGCCGILVYASERIVLRAQGGLWEIVGENLSICSLIGDRVVVRGRIHGVLPEKAGDGEC